MPTVEVFQDALVAAFGENVTQDYFDALCFEFGLELDEVTSEQEMAKKEKGVLDENLSDRTIFKVDVPANRYDLLCIEGLVRALKIFRGDMAPPVYKLSTPKPKAEMKVTVCGSVRHIRPFCVAAVLRGVTFNKDGYDSFIALQDKLHWNIGHRRTLVSIGTHDLSTLTPPFSYEALPPQEIVFQPLNQTEVMNGHRMMEVLSEHQQLKAYLHIIRDKPCYPVIYDSKRVVCSLPPIINGEHSKIRLDTKDVFIEVTAMDMTKANIVLNTVVAMFSEHCAKPFLAEPVEVEYASDYEPNSFAKPGDKFVYPQLDTTPMKASISRLKNNLSLGELTGAEVQKLLTRMSVHCEIDKKDKDVLNVDVPVTRSDIMHECDLLEDLAIAYGYNNLKTEVPATFSGASGQKINHLSDLVRNEVAMAGFTECMGWALISHKENWHNMRREEKLQELWRLAARPHEYSPGIPAVVLSNSSTKDFELLRTSILPGLLKTTGNVKHNPPPIKIFEVGDVVLQEPTRETGSRNVRRVCALNTGMKSNLSLTHGVLDQLMYTLNCEPEHEHEAAKKKGAKTLRKPFKLVASDDPSFFPGMQAHVVVEGTVIGVLGELHPEVMTRFDINMPASAFEINLEPFLEWL